MLEISGVAKKGFIQNIENVKIVEIIKNEDNFGSGEKKNYWKYWGGWDCRENRDCQEYRDFSEWWDYRVWGENWIKNI